MINNHLAIVNRVSISIHVLSSLRFSCATLTLSVIFSLSACHSSVTDPVLSGSVYGGTQPIVGANVYIYDAGTTPGAMPSEIGTAITDSQGAFKISHFSVSPAPGDLIYVTSLGGNGGGGNNATTALMGISGVFGSQQFVSKLMINELTTVAAGSQLANVLSNTPCSSIKSNTITSSNCISVIGVPDWTASVTSINSLVNASTGVSQTSLNTTTVQTMNLEASVLAACVNTAGGVAGDNSSCGNLLTAAASPSGTGTLINNGLVTTSGNSPFGITTNAVGSYAYVSNFTDGTVSMFKVDATGSLSSLGSDVSTGSGSSSEPTGITISPNNKFAYVVNCADASVSAFSINANGTLVSLGNSVSTGTSGDCVNLNVGSIPVGIAITPDSKFLYVANYSDGTIVGFNISSSGTLSSIGAPVQAGVADLVNLNRAISPQWMVISPTGGFMYVSNLNQGLISTFSISSTGALTLKGQPIPTGNSWASNPFGGTLSPDGSLLFVANYNEGSVSTFRVNATGALSVLDNEAITGLSGGLRPIVVSPDGAFMFVASASSGLIYGYSINIDSTLTAVGVPINAGTGFTSVSISPNGQYILLTANTANQIATFGVSQPQVSNTMNSYMNLLANSSGVVNSVFNLKPSSPDYAPLPSSAPTTLLVTAPN